MILLPLLNAQKHTFALGTDEFLLDGRPLQIISGEMHPARIPPEYWRQRIRMAKAMGCNTIAAYLFWNFHEIQEGQFDFRTGARDIARFIRLVQEEGMWVLLRPGPYVCAEWDFGGLPTYLLREPDIRVRCLDPRYMKTVERYLTRLAEEIKPLLVSRGGPILLLQIENEYGSYGNDKAYLDELKRIWLSWGIDIPFFTADGPTEYMLEAGSLPGAAVGLDSGSSESDFLLAKKMIPGVPVFSSETYPGWLTHWGESWARPDVPDLLREVDFLLKNRKSFNFYVIHGGTNFGFTAGANSGGRGYEPDITSYDYDAPIDEQGRATGKFHALRALIAAAQPNGRKLSPIPPAIPVMDIPEIEVQPFTSIWTQLPTPIVLVQPRTFESLGQNQGLMLYRTRLVGRKSGRLVISDLHDYATVFLDGAYIGKLDRRLGENTLDLPKTDSKSPILDILVEGMGHINFAAAMIDRKGITDRVTLSGMTLMNWEQFPLPLDEPFVSRLKTGSGDSDRPGMFFRGEFQVGRTADTFLDLGGYQKGVVWVNGRNLGRYWDIGPQKRLYCPAPWLKKGKNEIIIFDLHQTRAAPVRGEKTMIWAYAEAEK